jgi:hypothetical protein
VVAQHPKAGKVLPMGTAANVTLGTAAPRKKG